jgi:hypothetical protein
MALLSANDDFCRHTLAALHSVTQKLAYVTGLRDRAGQYAHWGLTRTHGPDAAQQAIAENHSRVWLEVLRMPLPEVISELEAMGRTERLEVLESLGNACARSCPDDLGGGTARHFNSIVLSLQLVFRHRDGMKAA